MENITKHQKQVLELYLKNGKLDDIFKLELLPNRKLRIDKLDGFIWFVGILGGVRVLHKSETKNIEDEL